MEDFLGKSSPQKHKNDTLADIEDDDVTPALSLLLKQRQDVVTSPNKNRLEAIIMSYKGATIEGPENIEQSETRAAEQRNQINGPIVADKQLKKTRNEQSKVLAISLHSSENEVQSLGVSKPIQTLQHKPVRKPGPSKNKPERRDTTRRIQVNLPTSKRLSVDRGSRSRLVTEGGESNKSNKLF